MRGWRCIRCGGWKENIKKIRGKGRAPGLGRVGMSGGIWKFHFVKGDIMRQENSTVGEFKTTVSSVIWWVTKKDAKGGARVEFVCSVW